jgi:two-component system chemotaxis response regulator CheB
MSVPCSRSWPSEIFSSGTWSPTKAWKLKTGSRWAADFQHVFDAEALRPHSGYTCPDCNGSLMGVSDNNYRCRVDHALTADALLKARTGMLHRRWRCTDLADEAERAVTVIGRRLSEATSGAGERGDG